MLLCIHSALSESKKACVQLTSSAVQAACQQNVLLAHGRKVAVDAKQALCAHLDPCPCLARDTSDTQLACGPHFDHSIAQLATAEWREEEDDLEHALGGGDGATGPPQEMALLDKGPGTLSDDVSSGSGSETGSHGGSSRGGGPGGSRKSLLQPSTLKSSSQASF